LTGDSDAHHRTHHNGVSIEADAVLGLTAGIQRFGG
jgi:hypothetical protein